MQTLSTEQARQLLQAAQGERFEAACVLALTTGMREGEILGLKWGTSTSMAGFSGSKGR